MRARGSGMQRRSVSVNGRLDCSGGVSLAKDALRHRTASRIECTCCIPANQADE